MLQDSSNNQNSYRNSEKKKMRVNIKESLLTIDKEKVESLTEDLEKITFNNKEKSITHEFEDEKVEFEDEENIPISKLVLKPNGVSHNHNGFSSKRNKKRNKDKKN